LRSSLYNLTVTDGSVLSALYCRIAVRFSGVHRTESVRQYSQRWVTHGRRYIRVPESDQRQQNINIIASGDGTGVWRHITVLQIELGLAIDQSIDRSLFAVKQQINNKLKMTALPH